MIVLVQARDGRPEPSALFPVGFVERIDHEIRHPTCCPISAERRRCSG
jgi:hypothetical protein